MSEQENFSNDVAQAEQDVLSMLHVEGSYEWLFPGTSAGAWSINVRIRLSDERPWRDVEVAKGRGAKAYWKALSMLITVASAAERCISKRQEAHVFGTEYER